MAFDRIIDWPRLGWQRGKPDPVTLADCARDARQWELATQLYRKALDRTPNNPPIWVQYGHALKESGELRDPEKLAQAEVAYRRALWLDPSVADSHLQLGHILKLQGKTEEARAAYLRAFVLDSSLDNASLELTQFGWSEVQRAELRTMAGQVDPEALGSDPPIGSRVGVSHELEPVGGVLSEASPGATPHATGTSRIEWGKVRVAKLRALAGLGRADAMDSGIVEDLDIAADQLAPLFDLAFLARRYGLHFSSVEAAANAYFAIGEGGRFDPSPCFSADLYLTLHPDVRAGGADPLRHYLCAGRFEGRSPHPLFNVPLVLEKCKDVSPQDVYTSFLQGNLNVQFHELVDFDYVASQCPELTSATDIFRALCDSGRPLSFSPHPLFDPELYRWSAGVKKFENELLDFLVRYNSCIVTCSLFDPVYYLETARPATLTVPPLVHYLQNWRTMQGDVSPIIDIKFLNHKLIQLGGDSGSAPAADPLTFALTRYVNASDALLHPHIDTRVIGRAFGNLIGESSPSGEPRPEAQRVAQLIKRFIISDRSCSTNAPLVSIVILNFHKHVYTFFSVLAALNAFEHYGVEIIVVENGGESIHYEWMKRQFAKHNNIKFMKMKLNKYFGEGCNIGADCATGSYILYLNNDCFLSPDYGAEFCEFQRSSCESHVIGALMLFPSGEVQEFGGLASDCGQVIQRAKGMERQYLAGATTPEKVDYASAACLVVSRAALASVAGFDPAFEPFFYEDTDLCRRLRKAGFDIVVHPKLTATHVENATTRPSLGDQKFYSMVSEHKELYARRWLKNEGDGVYARPRTALAKVEMGPKEARSISQNGREVALVYTPFDIRPGGGERYILSVAKALSRDHRVILCSTEPFSAARVLHTLHALDIDEFEFEISPNLEEVSALARDISLSFVMGNEIVPPIAPIGRANLYHLQFPFPWRNVGTWQFNRLRLYDAVVVNSEFTRKWTLRRAVEAGIQKTPPVFVLNPPIRMRHIERSMEKSASSGTHLITVGRFFTGGHSKRQDVFLEILELARELSGVPITATIVGGVHPNDDARQFYLRVRQHAEEIGGVEMIFDASGRELTAALESAHIYVHCAGFDVVEDVYPEALEHFGISIVEALLAGCIPVVFGAGGPLEIMERSRCGFTFRSVDVAAQLICRLVDPAERRRVLATFDRIWAEDLLDPAFDQNVHEIVSRIRLRTDRSRDLDVGLENRISV